MTDREWLMALRVEIAQMADDMETQRRAYVDLIARSEQLAADLDRTSAAYLDALAELDRIYASVTWRVHERLRRGNRPPPPVPGETPLGTEERRGGSEEQSALAGPNDLPGLVERAFVRAHADWNPSVSIIVPTRDRADLLEPLLRSLARTAWDDWELVLVDNGTTDPVASQLLNSGPHKVVHDDGEFNFPRLITRGVESSSGEVVVLLNNDIEVDDPDWLAALVDCLASPGCGIASGILFYPDGTIQHAGLEFQGNEPMHIAAGKDPREVPSALLDQPRVRTAVTGACLAMRRSTWNEIGGLDPLFAQNYNDVDLCLRVNETGQNCVVTPFARLIHKESSSRGPGWNREIAADRAMFTARWGPASLAEHSGPAGDRAQGQDSTYG